MHASDNVVYSIKLLLTITAFLAFGIAQAQQQTQGAVIDSAANASSGITAESLSGKYAGTYQRASVRSFGSLSNGMELTISSSKGNKVQGSISLYGRLCGGTFPIEGTLEGEVLDITIQGMRVSGCESNNLRLSVLENGNRLEGDSVLVGADAKIRLSKK